MKFGAVFGVTDVLRICISQADYGDRARRRVEPQAAGDAGPKIFVGAAYAEHSRRGAAVLAVQSGLLLFLMMFRICRPKMMRRATEL